MNKKLDEAPKAMAPLRGVADLCDFLGVTPEDLDPGTIPLEATPVKAAINTIQHLVDVAEMSALGRLSVKMVEAETEAAGTLEGCAACRAGTCYEIDHLSPEDVERLVAMYAPARAISVAELLRARGPKTEEERRAAAERLRAKEEEAERGLTEAERQLAETRDSIVAQLTPENRRLFSDMAREHKLELDRQCTLGTALYLADQVPRKARSMVVRAVFAANGDPDVVEAVGSLAKYAKKGMSDERESEVARNVAEARRIYFESRRRGRSHPVAMKLANKLDGDGVRWKKAQRCEYGRKWKAEWDAGQRA